MAPCLLPRAAGAQELEPRSYANTPVGLNFLIAGYAYQEATSSPTRPCRWRTRK